MAVKDIFKVSRKTFFNPSAWLGISELKGYNQVYKDAIKNTFVVPKPRRRESFKEAMKRQGLTEEKLQAIDKQYLITSFVFLMLGVLTFFISFYYLIHHGSIAGWILCLAVMALFLAQAFRYHFWHFQIKHRKLGCTFAEWRSGKVKHTKD